jgi:hypothetical protein
VLADEVQAAVGSNGDLGDAAWHARGQLADVQLLAGLVVAVDLLEEHRPVHEVEQRLTRCRP